MDGRTVVGRGRWSGGYRQTVGYQICGERSLTVRVTRHGAAGGFSLSVVQP